jgi:hypothetical protein
VIDRARIADFLVALDIERYGTSAPVRRDVPAPLEAWLGGLDPDELLAAYAIAVFCSGTFVP